MPIQVSLKRNVILNVFRTLLSIIFPLITFPYAARVLQPEGIGSVQFASGVISYFVMFAGLGIGVYGIREAAKKRDNRKDLTKISKELFLLNIIPTVIAYFLFAIALLFVPKLSAYRDLLMAYSATILFSVLGMEWLYSALEQYAYITLRQLIFQVISLVALFVFVKNRDDAIKYALISVFANVGSNICNLIHSRKYIDWNQSVSLEIRRHLKPVLILFGMRVAASLYVTLDTTLLGFLADDCQVGYYEAANKMTRIVVMLITSVIGVMLPRLSYFAEKKNMSAFIGLSEKSIRIMLMFALPMMVGLYVLSGNITLVISGVQFEPAIPIMRLLSFLVVIIPLSGFIGNQLFLPLGKEQFSLYAMLTGAATNLILSVPFIRFFGAWGAALASVIAETGIVIFYVVSAYKMHLFAFSLKPVLLYTVASVCMAIPVFLFNSIALPLFTKTICAVLLGMLVYTFLLFLVHDKMALDLYGQIKQKLSKQ